MWETVRPEKQPTMRTSPTSANREHAAFGPRLQDLSCGHIELVSSRDELNQYTDQQKAQRKERCKLRGGKKEEKKNKDIRKW